MCLKNLSNDTPRGCHYYATCLLTHKRFNPIYFLLSISKVLVDRVQQHLLQFLFDKSLLNWNWRRHILTHFWSPCDCQRFFSIKSAFTLTLSLACVYCTKNNKKVKRDEKLNSAKSTTCENVKLATHLIYDKKWWNVVSSHYIVFMYDKEIWINSQKFNTLVR